jgi:UDP-2,3-diacylglucosamine pyrophosphatase LpxH
MAKKSDKNRVWRAMDGALQRALKQEREQGEFIIDLDKSKYIIFSDHHKATRKGNDDFKASERAYNAALAYYYIMGYTLIALGDVEELWEERTNPVINSYHHTLELEAQFSKAGRYLRFWGNHDDDWRYPERVTEALWPIYGAGLAVQEVMVMRIHSRGSLIGSLLLAHGHQGTLDSDDLRPIARPFVRRIWRPLQRITKIPSTTPATDWRLRRDHNAALYNWSARQNKLVLIAGHTHRPIFLSKTHAAQIAIEIKSLQDQIENDHSNNELQEKLGQAMAEMEWVWAQQNQQAQGHELVEQLKPSYFNTGCCCFPDGDVTGLEIVNGEIHLVRWPDDNGRPIRSRPSLAHARLKDVFAEL